MLARALDGEKQALEQLVGQLTPVIARRVVRALVKAGQTEAAGQLDFTRDLIQDIFLDLFDNGARVLRGWRPEGGLSLGNFVGLVAERRTQRRLSKIRSAAAELQQGERLPDSPSTVQDPEKVAMARDNWRDMLYRVEERLTPTGRQMFELIFVKEKSMAEIGQETHLSRDAIYAWRSRLRKLAWKIYHEEEGGSPEPSRKRFDRRRVVVEGGRR